MKVVESLAESKQQQVELILKGDHALLHLDARNNEVIVPEHLKSNAALTLKISYLFQGQLTVSATGIDAYLRFSGNYFQCIIPWEAIWGVSGENGEQRIWPESLPQDLLAQLDSLSNAEEPRQEPDRPEADAKKENEKSESQKRPQLKRIK